MFVYLDNSSTTRQYDEVTDRMVNMMKEDFGNPSSLHRMGVAAERAVKEARKAASISIGAREDEIFFTGGGTEADNTAIFGSVYAKRRQGNKIIASAIEHPAVLEACKKLQKDGFETEFIGVDEKGLIDLEELKLKLSSDTVLVTVMMVNNELGTVQPIREIGELIKEKGGILFHTDAVQAYGRIPIDTANLPVDLLSISGHKIHGPKGIGALYIRKGLHIEPYLFGGGQESGFRSGTENTPGIAGFGIAAEKMHKTYEKRINKIESARNYLLAGIKDRIEDITINSPEEVYNPDSLPKRHVCSPSVLNVSFLGCRGEVLLHTLEQRDIYVSTGAACSSRKKGSHVMAAAGLAADRIESAIRFSVSEFNTVEQMDYVLVELKKAVGQMRTLMRKR